ncbi:hypothetical protein SNOG_06684 [Parastagonospora nodorum SN15]|uniref:Uncharacterized protein n=1 Tax=Phaeosphaeria nodorum (strain SN15 / ATCC MYA-4574 / FGSC 10173) TaxID=321614 RepID=Q0UNI0_PHANO|nr:hypothetical protein SNOG_06684 [Parastagonospora nodorum SN15]EAT86515.1 hypothetical protein SNOG_06684 [Parastagonospora nodorum SN15]
MKEHTSIVNVLNEISLSSLKDESQRSKALLAAYALVARLETPWETTARLCMGQPALGATLKVCMDLQLFERWHDVGDKSMSSTELAELVQCEAALLERFVRHLASSNMLNETSIGIFDPTPFTKSLLDPVFGEWIHHLRQIEYLAQNQYKVPLDPANGVFQYTKSCKGDMFDYYASHPREGESFNHIMGGVMARQAGWLEIYPHERVLETALADGPLVVDVGGNIGHDMERFRAAHPEIASRLYLQDRPEVVRLSKCPDPVHKMPYDFFTPQPVKGARTYYMHGVLHDWSDAPAGKILAMQRDALTPGYSSLLIHDHIAPRAQAHPHSTAYDLTMMVMVAGTERTESDWEKLLQSEGYKIVKIWTSPLAVQSIIEAELA